MKQISHTLPLFPTIADPYHSNDISVANYYRSQLQPLQSFGEPESMFEFFILEFALLIKQNELEIALEKASSKLGDQEDRSTGTSHKLPNLIYANGS